MGFLSSLFGGGDSRPATSTNVISQKLPTEIAPYVSQILTEGSEQFEAEKAAGYQPYTGQTTAGLTAQQEAALTGLEGLSGTQQPFLDEAGQIIRQGADQFTGDVAQQYMSPYQQAVTDIELREAGRRFEGTTMPKLEAQAVNMGAMSGLGSRAGVEMAEAQRSQNQLLADIQAKGQQKAYESARQEYGQQKAREGQMAENVAQLGGREVAAGLTELGALKSAGEERQGLAQSALDEAYLKYQQEQQFPKQNLAEFSQLVYGNPLVNMATTSRTGTDTPYQPSTGQTLLGMGLGAANIYGMGGGFGGNFSGQTLTNRLYGKPKAEGGPVGGGLDSLPVVRRAVNGPTRPKSALDIITDKLKNPNLSDDERAVLIRQGATGYISPTNPSTATVKKQNKDNLKTISNITNTSTSGKKEIRNEGLTALNRALNISETANRDNLDNTINNQRANLIEGMKIRGASRKEIQDALAKLPKVGPGLSTKTGSAQGIGKDITNVLDTLRTDVYKQAQLDRQQERADIKDIGRMKRSDQEKGIEGESSITSFESEGKRKNIKETKDDAKLITSETVKSLTENLNDEELSALKIFAAKQKGINKLEELPVKALKEFMDIYKLRLKEEEINAASKKGNTGKSPQGYIKDIRVNILQGSKFKIDTRDPTGTKIMVKDGITLKPGDAEKMQETLMKAESDFYDNLRGKVDTRSMNAAYNKWNKTFRFKNSTAFKTAVKPSGVPANFKKGMKGNKIIWIDPTNPQTAYDASGTLLP